MGLRRRGVEVAVAAVFRFALERGHSRRRRGLCPRLLRTDRYSRNERQCPPYHTGRRLKAPLAGEKPMSNRAEAQARIDATLSEAVAAGGVPGVVAMATDGVDVLYEGAFGVRDLGKGPAMTLDTVFRIASMTKAITSVAAMQLVEAGKLTLDSPVPAIDPALSEPKVLEGFDGSGAPILRPAKRPITLRHLLTHTAGFTYEAWNANTLRYVRETGTPSTQTGKIAALRPPLAFEPRDKLEDGSTL